jgi:hypothetical protein
VAWQVLDTEKAFPFSYGWRGARGKYCVGEQVFVGIASVHINDVGAATDDIVA